LSWDVVVSAAKRVASRLTSGLAGKSYKLFYDLSLYSNWDNFTPRGRIDAHKFPHDPRIRSSSAVSKNAANEAMMGKTTDNGINVKRLPVLIFRKAWT
jgi:hypothetical protein